jgi:hypothetical protein
MMGRKREPYPYVMRRPPEPKRRPTIADEPDSRIAHVRQPILSLRGVHRYTRQLPAPLLVTDRVMQRWARSIGDGLPSEEWDEGKTPSRLSPLDDELAIQIDRIVLAAPQHLRQMFQLWYKTPLPVNEIGRRFGVDRDEVIRRWKAALEWIRPQLIGSAVA